MMITSPIAIVLALCGHVVCTGNYFETFYIPAPVTDVLQRNALRMEQYKWPSAEIPYVFDAAYGMRIKFSPQTHLHNI